MQRRTRQLQCDFASPPYNKALFTLFRSSPVSFHLPSRQGAPLNQGPYSSCFPPLLQAKHSVRHLIGTRQLLFFLMKGCTRGCKSNEKGSNWAWSVRQVFQEDVLAEINLKGQTGRLISHPWESRAEKLFQLCTVWVYPSHHFSSVCRGN